MIKVKYGRDYVTYRDEDLLKMSKQQLKVLKSDLQNNIEEIALKKRRYEAENSDYKNTLDYCSRINKYKSAILFAHKAISHINTFVDDDEQEDTEHWLWCYYQESKKLLRDDCVADLENMADERAGYHINVEGV